MLLLSSIIMFGLSISFFVFHALNQPLNVLVFSAVQCSVVYNRSSIFFFVLLVPLPHTHTLTQWLSINAVAILISIFFLLVLLLFYFIFVIAILFLLLCQWMCVFLACFSSSCRFFLSSSPFSKCVTCDFALSKSKFQVFRTDDGSDQWFFKCYFRKG